jgi:hypothetical protein
VLPRLAESRETVKLIPFSGIQFLDVGCIAGDEFRKFRRDFFEDISSAGESKATLLRATPQDEGNDYVVDGQPGRIVAAEEVYSVRGTDALETFARTWIPVPMFRIHEHARGRAIFMSGPTAWARLHIAPLEEKDEYANTHRLVFAFDTSLVRRTADAEERPYVAPYDSDSDEQKSFRLVDDRGRLAFFCNLPYVDQWLGQAFEKHLDDKYGERRRIQRAQAADGEKPRACEHWARFLTLIELLNDHITLPTIVLAGTMSPIQGEPPIKVDLVLDIGNSRTCGILIERDEDRGQPSLLNSYPLELRDLSRPERVYSEPFESRVEFAKADFGNEQLTMKAGRPNAFTWYSMVRTGTEALELCISAKGGEGATGLSSPKRYLWDEEAQPHMWRFNLSLSRHSHRGSMSVDGPVMAHITEDGRVLSTISETKRHAQNLTEAFEPHFSRCSLFTFLLQEVFLQAFVQINSIANRAKRPKSDRHRKLDKIVLTLPPGMPLPERRRFNERADAAMHLLWDCFSAFDRELFSKEELAAGKGIFVKDRKHEKWPNIVEPYDEASSTQIVYLYSEMLRLQNGISDLFDAYGVVRPGKGKGKSLRIASIDIGGGTTDLMVITHKVEHRNFIVPEQNFRESFRLAGDDILREVINSTVLPSIEEYARAKGIARPQELTGRMFGAFNMTEPERIRRRQLVVEVIAPIGLELLRRCEEPVPFGRTSETSTPVGEFFTGKRALSAHVLGFIDREAQRLGAQEFHLIEAPIRCVQRNVESMICGLIGPILASLGEVVRDLGCDLVLLTGRPSRLPLVRDVVLGNAAVTPDRVFCMSGYRVGNWYPFRNNLGQIADPKTTAAVGAALSWLARGDLGGINFASSELKHRSTARYIGILEEGGKLRNDNIVMSNIDLDAAIAANEPGTLIMPARLMLGYRQLPLERWRAMPLYELSFKKENMPPVRVTLVRKDPRRPDDEFELQSSLEDFAVTEVEPIRDDGHLRITPRDINLRLQTLPNRDGYWIDTGVIKG